MNLGNLTTQIKEVARSLAEARTKDDEEEIERLEVELENLRDDIDDFSLDIDY